MSFFEMKKRPLPSVSSILKDLAAYVIGALLYAVSVNVFSAPNNVAPGGVTGIATMINSFVDIPIGSLMMLINIPLFILGVFIIGWRYILRTFVVLGLISGAIDLTVGVLPQYTGDTLLAALFGGVLLGISLGIVFMRGGSTGGSDIVARMFGKAFPHITQGNLILCIDMLVVVAAALVYDLESGLYALIALFVSSFALDKVLYGADTGKMMLILSSKIDDINSLIINKLDRGTTLLTAKGGFSGGDRPVLMCAVRRDEAHKIRSEIKRIDPNAFIIMTEATEIFGEGFKSVSENEFGEKS